jgi:hypothetical protein
MLSLEAEHMVNQSLSFLIANFHFVETIGKAVIWRYIKTFQSSVDHVHIVALIHEYIGQIIV